MASSKKPTVVLGDNSVATADYEKCDECGFDHLYETNEAVRKHAEIDSQRNGTNKRRD